jgi:hypothetical protein
VGFKAHSGWAALVAIGGFGSDICVIDRRVFGFAPLIDDRAPRSARAPTHHRAEVR